jgi:hypothetical protein
MILLRLATIKCLVMTLALTALVSCGELPAFADLKRGPTFLLDRSGRLASFRLYGPRPGHKIATPFDAESLMWCVQPSAGYFRGTRVQRLIIEFGKVPAGYTQTVPKESTVPKLPSHMAYYFFAETTDAPPAQRFFYLDGDVPTEIGVPGLCQSGFVGDVRPLKCGTTEPYVEPTNLEQFVRENRVAK